MKKEVYFFGIIFLVLSIGIVSAVWWNPSTWFDQDGDNIVSLSDCDYSDPYVDCDGDGVNNGVDCSSANPLVDSNKNVIADYDLDGHCVGSSYVDCVGATAGPHRQFPPDCTDFEDCDDRQPAAWYWDTYRRDFDFDGYCGASEKVCSGTSPPAPYKLSSDCAGDDCKYCSFQWCDYNNADERYAGCSLCDPNASIYCLNITGIPAWKYACSYNGDPATDLQVSNGLDCPACYMYYHGGWMADMFGCGAGKYYCPLIDSPVNCTENPYAFKCINTYINVSMDQDLDGSGTLWLDWSLPSMGYGPGTQCLGSTLPEGYVDAVYDPAIADCDDSANYYAGDYNYGGVCWFNFANDRTPANYKIVAPLINCSNPLYSECTKCTSPLGSELCTDGADNTCDWNTTATPPGWARLADCADPTCDGQDISAKFPVDPATGKSVCNDGVGSDNCQCCSYNDTTGNLIRQGIELERWYFDPDLDGYGSGVYRDVCNEAELYNSSNWPAPPRPWVKNDDDCDNYDNRSYPGQPYYPDPADASELCWKCNTTGSVKVFDASLNTEGMKNCYVCNGETNSTDFVNNAQMGNGDCFFCDTLASAPATDPNSVGYYLDADGNLTNTPTVLKDPLPPSPECDVDTSVSPPTYTDGCYVAAPSDSLQTTIQAGEVKQNCNICTWKDGGYKWRKSGGEQAQLIFADEDPQNGGENCSMCKEDYDGSITGVEGRGYLFKDPTDSRVNAVPGSSLFSETYLCKKCSETAPGLELDDSDKRVNNETYLNYTCSVCSSGALNKKKNGEFAGITFTNTTTWTKQIDTDKKCCGGSVYDQFYQGCCPLSMTGKPEVDDYAGGIYTKGGNTKCCRKNIITANPGDWKKEVLELMPSYIITGLNYVKANYLKSITFSADDGIVNVSNDTRMLVNDLNADYCIGEGLEYGSDICTPCQPSRKTNMIVITAIDKLGSNLGYTAWISAQGASLLLNYRNLDNAVGLRGYPRYNRVCFKSTILSIPFTGGLGKNSCGECTPTSNSDLAIQTDIKFPFEVWGVIISKNWLRQQNTAECQRSYVGNNDLTKFASADGFTHWVYGTYVCTPEGECLVQNELVPGWIKYWTKKAIGAFSLYQTVHGTLQLLQPTQGGEIVDPLPCCPGSSSANVIVGSGNAQATTSTGGGLGDFLPMAASAAANVLGTTPCRPCP